MMAKIHGVITAAATPLHADFSIDIEKLIAHCAHLIDAGGSDGITLLGTTGEATSFSLEQRLGAMKAVAKSGLPLAKMMVGTGAAALDDAVRLTRAAAELGFSGALLLPPFYYKDIDDGSLTDYVNTVISRAGVEECPVYLYHIPQNSCVPFPIEVVARLHDRHKGRLAGLKDSAGDLSYSRALIKRVPGLDVFSGNEVCLIEARASGFAGCISATTNINGVLARQAWLDQDGEKGRKAMAEAMAIHDALSRFMLFSSVKWALADLKADATWKIPCPPLRALTDEEGKKLSAALAGTVYGTLK